MFKQFFNNSVKRISSLSPQAAIAGALIIVVVISGLALLLTRGSSEANANPALQPHAARLDRVEGNVGIGRPQNGGEVADESADWTEAVVNTPVTVGDRIYTRDYAHASVALSAQNYVRLNPATSLDVLALEDSRTQFALRSGSALFDVGALPSGALYEVATPCGAVHFNEPGLYQIGMDGENAIISVLNGVAEVVGQEGSGLITKGQVFTLTGATAAEALASTLAPATAGEIVDDYYRYRYPKVYNGRYRDYDAYLDDPSYYDPYRTSVSYQYLQADIPGLYDLDDYGDWIDVNDYGHCWAPRVNAGWAPFRSGYWDVDDLWGPSWVSYEPWGWAPYHYGRWAFVNQRWFWVPTEVRRRAVYCPAPVAFIPFSDQLAWLPLGPGEVYVPRYYDNFQPRYLASADVVQVVTVQNTFVNYDVPGAVTVVPVRALRRGIDPRVITPVDLAAVKRSRAVIDPFSVAGVRELARGDGGPRRIKFDRRERQALNTAVVASATPRVLPQRGDLAKRFKVEAVPENRKSNKLRVNNTDQVTSTRRADGLAQPPVVQSQRLNELATRAQQGDKSARREMRQLMREEQSSGKSLNQPGAQPPAARQPQAQQKQLRQQMKQQRRAERQQQAGAPAQQKQQQMRSQQQQQQKNQQQMRQQQQQQQKSQQQQQQMRQQQRQQKKAQPPARRKPPEASIQQQLRRDQSIQRAQASHRQAAKQQQHAARAQASQRQAAMQQQHAARTQASQRQAAKQQQHAARAQAAQRQAAKQQQHAARAQASQRQAVMQQQQAARAQAAQRQASPSTQRTPALQGGPARQDARKPRKP